MEELCSVHPNEKAVGKCSACRLPHCLDCLDMETGQVLCLSCMAKRTGQAAPGPAPTAEPVPASPGAVQENSIPPKPAASPFDFKGKGLDDDPLGLMNAPTPPKKAAPLPAPRPFVPDLKPLTPAAPSPQASTPKEPFSLEGPAKPSFSGLPEGSAPPLSYPLGSLSGVPAPPPQRAAKFFYLWKTWSKFLVRRSYETFDPLAKILRIPTFAAIALVGGLAFGAVLGIGILLRPSSVKLTKVLAPLHLIKVGPGQITDLNVTAFMELQGRVQNLGFDPLTQLTVAQLSPVNYLDVWIKEDIATYGEILKFPNEITPHLSFVTVFTSGLWLATNSWQGGQNQMAFLSSECFPNVPPDQLYVKHVQRVERMKKEGFQPGLMGENRYIAALSDHLRWYLDEKDLPAYKAEFKSFH